MAVSARLRRVLPDRLAKTRSPADFDAWMARGPSSEGGFPSDWPDFADLPGDSGAQVAALVHVFYPELLDELIDQLASIPVPFDLIITDATGTGPAVDSQGLPQVRRRLVLGVENRGRDLWPLVQVVNAGFLDPYELVIKVHTKRSSWREDHAQLDGSGTAWRGTLLSALLGDAANIKVILDAFQDEADLGMVTADGSVLGSRFWGRDRRATASLLRRLGIELRPDALAFPAGSMYWARSRVLRRLRDLRMTSDDFEPEAGQIDGTTSHALERVIGLLATDAGLRIAERSRVPQGAERRP